MLKETVAVLREGGKPVLLTIHVGSILTLLEQPSQDTGKAKVEWDGKNVELFAIDLAQRSEEIDVSGS